MDSPRSASVDHWGGGHRNRGPDPCRASFGSRASGQGQPPDRLRASPPRPPADLAPIEKDSAPACRDLRENQSRGLVQAGTRSRTTNQPARSASRSRHAAGSLWVRLPGGASCDNHGPPEKAAPRLDKARWPSIPPRQCYALRRETATFPAELRPLRTSTADSARAQSPSVAGNPPDAPARETDWPPMPRHSALRPPSPTTPAGQPPQPLRRDSHDNGAYSPR